MKFSCFTSCYCLQLLGSREYTWHHPDEEKELCDSAANVRLCEVKGLLFGVYVLSSLFYFGMPVTAFACQS